MAADCRRIAFAGYLWYLPIGHRYKKIMCRQAVDGVSTIYSPFFISAQKLPCFLEGLKATSF